MASVVNRLKHASRVLRMRDAVYRSYRQALRHTETGLAACVLAEEFGELCVESLDNMFNNNAPTAKIAVSHKSPKTNNAHPESNPVKTSKIEANAAPSLCLSLEL